MKNQARKPTPPQSKEAPPLMQRVYVAEPGQKYAPARMSGAQRTIILFMILLLVALVGGLCLLLTGKVVPF